MDLFLLILFIFKGGSTAKSWEGPNLARVPISKILSGGGGGSVTRASIIDKSIYKKELKYKRQRMRVLEKVLGGGAFPLDPPSLGLGRMEGALGVLLFPSSLTVSLACSTVLMVNACGRIQNFIWTRKRPIYFEKTIILFSSIILPRAKIYFNYVAS